MAEASALSPGAAPTAAVFPNVVMGKPCPVQTARLRCSPGA